jgi:hypothetical protein
MATCLFANLASGTLAGPITNTSVTAQLQAGEGVLFPNPGANEYFVGTFVDAATGLLDEIVHCTGVSGDTLTIVRAQEGTNALNWAAGDFFSNLWTAGQAEIMVQEVQFNPARVIAASGAVLMTNSDYALGFNRTTAVAASSVTLPDDTAVNQVYKFSDLAGNFNKAPLSIVAPENFTIAGLGEYVAQTNRMTVQVTLYPGNIFSLEVMAP